jgi:hypothetical protein
VLELNALPMVVSGSFCFIMAVRPFWLCQPYLVFCFVVGMYGNSVQTLLLYVVVFCVVFPVVYDTTVFLCVLAAEADVLSVPPE